LFLVVSTSAIDCLERLVSEITYCVSSGTLNPTYSVTKTEVSYTKLNHYGCAVFGVAE